MANKEMNETIKLATEIGKAMMVYKISEDDMKNIIKVHGGNVRAALRTIESTAKIVKILNQNN